MNLQEEWLKKLRRLQRSHEKGLYELDFSKIKAFFSHVSNEYFAFLYLALAQSSLIQDKIEEFLTYLKKAEENYHSSSLYITQKEWEYVRAWGFLWQGEMERCRKILSSLPEGKSLFLLAKFHHWQGDFAKCLLLYDRILEKRKEGKEEIQCEMARSYRQMGKWNKAEKILENLQDVEERFPDGETSLWLIHMWGELALVYALQKRIHQARAILRNALHGIPSPHPMARGAICFYQGQVKFLAHSLEGAREDLLHALQFPMEKLNRVEAFFVLGKIAEEECQWEIAQKWYEKT
ncbi:MAG: hypothetical protein DRI61_14785, partial [Chloroflexi bacterium]